MREDRNFKTSDVSGPSISLHGSLFYGTVQSLAKSLLHIITMHVRELASTLIKISTSWKSMRVDERASVPTLIPVWPGLESKCPFPPSTICGLFVHYSSTIRFTILFFYQLPVDYSNHSTLYSNINYFSEVTKVWRDRRRMKIMLHLQLSTPALKPIWNSSLIDNQ
jgi:hypothetical protein